MLCTACSGSDTKTKREEKATKGKPVATGPKQPLPMQSRPLRKADLGSSWRRSRMKPVYLAYWSSNGAVHCSFESWPGRRPRGVDRFRARAPVHQPRQRHHADRTRARQIRSCMRARSTRMPLLRHVRYYITAFSNRADAKGRMHVAGNHDAEEAGQLKSEQWRASAVLISGHSGRTSATIAITERRFRGRPGFDAGHEAAQGMPRSSHLVKPLETLNANDERYALAA